VFAARLFLAKSAAAPTAASSAEFGALTTSFGMDLNAR
jgi:hypothetical protein